MAFFLLSLQSFQVCRITVDKQYTWITKQNIVTSLEFDVTVFKDSKQTCIGLIFGYLCSNMHISQTHNKNHR